MQQVICIIGEDGGRQLSHKTLAYRLEMGEAYFAEKLLDYEQASNVGGWQWAAGSGTDATPYFRIFNPASQAEKFDADGKYAKSGYRNCTPPNIQNQWLITKWQEKDAF